MPGPGMERHPCDNKERQDKDQIGDHIARFYVEAGLPLRIIIYGRVLHHVDYGIALLVLTIAAIPDGKETTCQVIAIN